MKRLWLAAGVLLMSGLEAPACIWDRDTERMEDQTFPIAEHLIAGKFVRHSPAYYEWRVQDRQQKLAELDAMAPLSDRLALRDDLAVAYDKLGMHDEAVETARETLKMEPGRYESVANLGTLYIHAGELPRGLALIKEAIRINPNAHFGRERYQQYLVEYVLFRRKEGDDSLPLRRTLEQSPVKDFAHFLALRQTGWKPDQLPEGIQSNLDTEQRLAAVKGVEGMMHFGNFQSPILLEALGDVVAVQTRSYRRRSSLQQDLAAMAYLQAARLSPNREKAMEVYFTSENNLKLLGNSKRTVSDITKKLLPLLREGKEYFEEIAANEREWISEDVDVDVAFAKKYYNRPKSVPQKRPVPVSEPPGEAEEAGFFRG